MTYPLYIFFGTIPSIIWLLFYLRKDAHPESKRMIIKIFFFGMLVALPAIFIEKGLIVLFSQIGLLTVFLNIFIGVALVEELLKFSVVKFKVLKNPEFDEPVDAMIYMIIAALGFAAFENILILFGLGPAFVLGETVLVTFFRFLGATFLHALCSGLIGYFLVRRLLAFGIAIAVLLHGLYNFSILEMEGSFKLLVPIIILIGLAVFITFAFKRLKRIKNLKIKY